MSEKNKYQVAVIGSGPGGYVAAIRAAQLGLDTVCIEREELGGICLNWGCIPTKALLRSAEVLDLCRRADEFGIKVENVSFDFAAIIKRSRGVSSKINKGVGYLLRKNKIDHIAGTAKLAGAGRIDIALKDGGTRSVSADSIIIATGARARSLPGLEFDGERIIEYRKAMTLSERPSSMVVVGAGAIGVEFASFYEALGTEVTIVEYLDRLVPNEDEEISAELERAFKKRGIKLLTGHGVKSAKVSGDGVEVEVEPKDGGEAKQIKVDVVLSAVGVTGNVEDLGLEDIGVSVERGFIKVDEHMQTGVKGVYAIGDIIGPPALAHVASAEGVYAAEHIAGKNPFPVPYDAIPACTYCHPEIGSVGLTEAKAREQGIPIKVGRFPFKPLGKTMAAGEYPGMVKIIWHADDGSLVGAHMIGPAVTDLIAEMTLAKTTEVNADSLNYTIHAHPTFAEAIKEASEDAYGHAIHI
ncbi:dihydrolipoyl dehydrogenase [Haliangium ochraceum]|uniref:Dihydrolipoyl dehydrogenase n=1 Tax=Haliangium ochraceum (strain DSM 14365 / JCM 11303 / SMP-2) TaxID=502025 RepID=D0LY55_HALO1|nr:dihydrolipoyl dehydrogenase [Haliangium ochraceum]ACY16205.1 dihydrolipoamide dehydrogenase [Haliangium ochraceum DSM 14365]